jgi:hypothetical protein
MPINIQHTTESQHSTEHTSQQVAEQVADLKAQMATQQSQAHAQAQAQAQAQKQKLQLAAHAAGIIEDTFKDVAAAAGLGLDLGAADEALTLRGLEKIVQEALAAANAKCDAWHAEKGDSAPPPRLEPRSVPEGAEERATSFEWEIQRVDSDASLTTAIASFKQQIADIKELFGE